MTVGGIADYLKQHWPAIREQLMNETYEPKPVVDPSSVCRNPVKSFGLFH
jgi:hypothetical protein